MGTSASSTRRSRRRQQQENPYEAQNGQGGQRASNVPVSYHQPAGPGGAVHYPHAALPMPAAPPGQQQQQVQQNARPTSSTHEATTVRNLVNLKKHTLRLAPREGSPGVLEISFALDVVSVCRVSIFLIAQEDNSTGEITAKKVICDGAECPVGMNVRFPFEGMSPEQSAVDTSPYEPDELNAADITHWKYPLIIRLETLAKDSKPAAGATAGAAAPAQPPPQQQQQHALAERAAGAAMAPWVQSQTTYVVLGETEPDSDDDSKVVRQRIYVQGQHYLLQEIYGITEASNAQGGGDDDFSAHCVVCLTNRKNTTVLPCRHFCMCDECAKLLLKRTRTCPMCRLPISSVLNIQIRQNSTAA